MRARSSSGAAVPSNPTDSSCPASRASASRPRRRHGDRPAQRATRRRRATAIASTAVVSIRWIISTTVPAIHFPTCAAADISCGPFRRPHAARALANQMIKVKRIDHVAIAVADRDAAARQPERAVRPRRRRARARRDADHRRRLPASRRGSRRGRCRRWSSVRPRGNAALERFLARRGPGLHHVCFEVEDLAGRARRAEGGGRSADRRDAAPGRARPPRRLPAPRRDGRRAVRALRGGRDA